MIRITSYNVCYTKLLRHHNRLSKLIIFSSGIYPIVLSQERTVNYTGHFNSKHLKIIQFFIMNTGKKLIGGFLLIASLTLIPRITSYNVCYTKLLRSLDGIKWTKPSNPFFMKKEVVLDSGDTIKVDRLERPQFLIDEDGNPEVLYAACALMNVGPTKKGETFNVVITSYSIHYTKLYEHHNIKDAQVIVVFFESCVSQFSIAEEIRNNFV